MLSVVGQGDWLAAALLLPSPSQSPSAAVQLSADPYHFEVLRSLLTDMSAPLRSSSPSPSQPSALLHYSFSVSPSLAVILHPAYPDLCPTLHTACCRLQSSLSTIHHSPPATLNSDKAVDGDRRCQANGDTETAPSLTSSLIGEIAITAQDAVGKLHWIMGRPSEHGSGAVLLCEAEAEEEKECQDDDGVDAAAGSGEVRTNGVGDRPVVSSSRNERLFARGWQLLSVLMPSEKDR